MTVWAAGNNRHIVGEGRVSSYCMNTTRQSTNAAALDRNLRPQFYSSLGGQCWPLNPTVCAPTFGILPWGKGFQDMGEQGGATSSCAPMVAASLAIMMTRWPRRPFGDYRAALRASANNAVLGRPGVEFDHATGAGLLQAHLAVDAVPRAHSHFSWALEQALETSVSPLGAEPERIQLEKLLRRPAS